jgi:hypothetical protein
MRGTSRSPVRVVDQCEAGETRTESPALPPSQVVTGNARNINHAHVERVRHRSMRVLMEPM